MNRWRLRRKLDVPALIDLSQETYPGELSRPIRKDTPEDERNAADLDELEEEDRLMGNLPTVVVSATGSGQVLHLSITGPLGISRQVVEIALAELELHR